MWGEQERSKKKMWKHARKKWGKKQLRTTYLQREGVSPRGRNQWMFKWSWLHACLRKLGSNPCIPWSNMDQHQVTAWIIPLCSRDTIVTIVSQCFSTIKWQIVSQFPQRLRLDGRQANQHASHEISDVRNEFFHILEQRNPHVPHWSPVVLGGFAGGVWQMSGDGGDWSATFPMPRKIGICSDFSEQVSSFRYLWITRKV